MKIHLITNNRESSDIKLAICCLAVVLTAWVFIGYIPGFSFMGADALNSLLPMLYQLDSAEGDWHSLAYKFEALGGTNLLAVYGVLPLSILLAEMGASPLLSLNVSFIVIQWFFASLRCSQSMLLQVLVHSNGSTNKLPEQLPVACYWVSPH